VEHSIAFGMFYDMLEDAMACRNLPWRVGTFHDSLEHASGTFCRGLMHSSGCAWNVPGTFQVSDPNKPIFHLREMYLIGMLNRLPKVGVKHNSIHIVHNDRGTTTPMSNLQEGLAPNGRASAVNESSLQADQHGAPAGDQYDGIACMVCSTLLKHQDMDPKKSALAKAGVKVAQPTEYGESSNLEEFETFVTGIWDYIICLVLRVSRLKLSMWALTSKRGPRVALQKCRTFQPRG
jgi:hypothetical protein